ncbi:PQQ-binding-like beta-propeller repeat protein [Phycisphaeraceae bacterium D3-23]
MPKCLLSRLPYVLLLAAACLAIGACAHTANPPAPSPVTGTLNWRGVQQDGTSPQTGLPARAVRVGEGANLRWTLDTPGRGTATVAEYPDGPRLYAIGYPGDGAELLETLYCLDPETGEVIWQRGYADFISDIVYNRYSIGAPTIDPDTGNVFFQTSPGLVMALDRDGNQLWQVSLMETYGKLTFPNGRTGVITIDGDLAIVNCISTNWGLEGPARNRFYAFNKNSGELVWSSTPGVGPPFLKDSSFSTPCIENRQGYRVFYAGTGCGNLVCVNIRTGQPMWRYQMSFGGVNASPVIYDNGTPDDPADDLVIQVHGKENVGDTGRGYMIAIKADQALAAAVASDEEPLQLGAESVAWRNDDVSMFTSSPTLADGVVYQCTLEGLLVAIDAKTGDTLWEQKFGTDQLHASPLYADGKMYLAMWHDGLYIFEPTREGPGPIEHMELDEEDLCIGTPSAWNGKVYLHTTRRLYCFGNASGGIEETRSLAPYAQAGPSFTDSVDRVALVIQPAEFLIKPSETVRLGIRGVDQYGNPFPILSRNTPEIAPWIPPTARVRVELDATVSGDDASALRHSITASENNAPSAGAFRATSNGLSGTTRGRILPLPPYRFDFEESELGETDATDNVAYAYPPLPWLGARLKWQVRDDPTDPGNNQVLAKTLDRVLFQRSMIFMGHADDSDYTVQADVMTDGNRRGGSVVGVINQRYIIAIDANKDVVEVSSNPNRLAVTEPFEVEQMTWYTIKSMVVPGDDGDGTVYVKVWPRGEDEPEQWTMTVEVPNIHTQGAPGIYGFSPQSRFRVYVDNVTVTPNP